MNQTGIKPFIELSHRPIAGRPGEALQTIALSEVVTADEISAAVAEHVRQTLHDDLGDVRAGVLGNSAEAAEVQRREQLLADGEKALASAKAAAAEADQAFLAAPEDDATARALGQAEDDLRTAERKLAALRRLAAQADANLHEALTGAVVARVAELRAEAEATRDELMAAMFAAVKDKLLDWQKTRAVLFELHEPKTPNEVNDFARTRRQTLAAQYSAPAKG